MTITSMTGFARTSGTHDGLSWTWEVRSVNGRGLDCRLRLPLGCDGIESAARDLITKHLTRGNVSATLNFEKASANGSLQLNEAVARDVVAAADQLHALTGGPRATTADLLAVKGVLEFRDSTELSAEVQARQHQGLLDGLRDAVSQLISARQDEGARLHTVIGTQLDEMERLTEQVERSPSRTAEAVGARLRDLVEKLLGQADSLDPQRLHQEAILMATRADVAEELARLKAHIGSARDMMRSNGATGRKLDFLAQEFNREANTLCSKAVAMDVTHAGLALKALIDQFREQVQNIE